MIFNKIAASDCVCVCVLRLGVTITKLLQRFVYFIQVGPYSINYIMLGAPSSLASAFVKIKTFANYIYIWECAASVGVAGAFGGTSGECNQMHVYSLPTSTALAFPARD